MEISMDGRNEARLRSSSGRKKSEDALIEWWSNTRGKPVSRPRSVQVRDEGNRPDCDGVVTGDVPLRDQGVTPVGKLEEPEAVHSGYTLIPRPTRRRTNRSARRIRQGKSPLV